MKIVYPFKPSQRSTLVIFYSISDALSYFSLDIASVQDSLDQYPNPIDDKNAIFLRRKAQRFSKFQDKPPGLYRENI